jgi:hypothetical protein
MLAASKRAAGLKEGLGGYAWHKAGIPFDFCSWLPLTKVSNRRALTLGIKETGLCRRLKAELYQKLQWHLHSLPTLRRALAVVYLPKLVLYLRQAKACDLGAVSPPQPLLPYQCLS